MTHNISNLLVSWCAKSVLRLTNSNSNQFSTIVPTVLHHLSNFPSLLFFQLCFKSYPLNQSFFFLFQAPGGEAPGSPLSHSTLPQPSPNPSSTSHSIIHIILTPSTIIKSTLDSSLLLPAVHTSHTPPLLSHTVTSVAAKQHLVPQPQVPQIPDLNTLHPSSSPSHLLLISQ
jgi:hypothetical protein